jgi:hypothetical protein
LGQVVLLHVTQTPPVQRCSPVQAAPVPQPHAPALQLSLTIGSHAEHCTPPVPQASAVPVMQTLLAQQPLGQVAGVQAGATQAPPTHCWPPPQAGLAPHLQAPAAQVSAVFESHIAQTEPPVPHMPSDGVFMQVSPEQQPLAHDVASQTQAPPTHRVPAPHAGPVPQAQLPPAQVSEIAGSHAAQASPGAPQVPSD